MPARPRPTSRPLRLGLLLVAAGCPGAVEPTQLEPLDAEVALVVTDSTGAAHPVESIPRRPRLTVALGLDAADATEQVLLVSGGLDAALAADLRSPPWSTDTRARAQPLEVEARAGATTVRPSQPLTPGTTVTLVVPPWARTARGGFVGVPRVVSLTVRQDAAGAVWVESFPAAGSLGLPTQLASVDLAFDDAVEGLDSLQWVRAEGPVAARVSALPCGSAGLRGHTCARVLPPPLGPSETVRLVGRPRDRFGDEIEVDLPLTTGTLPEVAPEPAVPACAPDELTLPLGCVLVLDDRVVLRARFLAPARVRLGLAGVEVLDVTRYGATTLEVRGLPASTELALTASAESTSGTSTSTTTPIRTAPPRPAFVLQELRPNPAGPEPAQESVLLCSREPEPRALDGATLSDDPSRAGDPLPEGVVLAPSGCVLLVSDAFDPTAPLDLSPPLALPLVRLGASLASSGLANGGEPLILRGPDGSRWASAPAVAVAEEGRCAVRDDVDPRDEATYRVGPCRFGLP